MTDLANHAATGTLGGSATGSGYTGNAFDALFADSGCSVSYDATHPLHGAQSYKVVDGSTAGNSILVWTTSLTGSSVTKVWFRGNFYLTANPSATLLVINARTTGGTIRGSVGITSAGKVVLQNAAFSNVKTSTMSVPLNQWFRLEGYILGDASVGQMEVKIFSSVDSGTPDETQTTTATQNTGGSIVRINYGNPVSVASYTFWMQDLGVSTTAYMGPAYAYATGGIKLKKIGLSATVQDKKIRLSWDTSDRIYFQGVSMGVFYPKNTPGVAWSGLVSVTEKGDDASSALYVDGQLVKNRLVPSAFAGTITAFTYPDEFDPYIGNKKGLTAQNKQTFGLTYRSNRELHIVYNVLVAPSNDEYVSLGESITPVVFSWDFTTKPNATPDARPTAHLVVMLDTVHPDALSALEDILYGDDANDPALPAPQGIFDLFDTYATLRIVDNGDGTFTATDDGSGIITMLDDETFQIDWPSIVIISDTEYILRSL